MKTWMITYGVSLSVLLVTSGCALTDGSEGHASTPAAGLRAVTPAESAALQAKSGIVVTGALPTIETTRATRGTGKRLQDVTVGGPYGSGPYYTSAAYYTGFSGRAGSFIDAIKFDGPWNNSGTYGGDGGSPFSGIACAGAGGAYVSAIIGIRGRAGVYIDQLGPLCGNLADSWAAGGIGANGTAPPGAGPGIRYTRSTAITDGPTIGGTGGDEFRYSCPMSDWIVGWAVESSQYVDRLTAYCGHW